ncbi:hypothetical protein SAMN04487991_0313 [Celeribacter neptunius]|uniref:Antibiotic biosynthesis monooxygenase n=2 Tax=Celeribacter neptunius TaxID=588602 RepID=A0A1I3JD03_9RHOB|nr:hypothetical protein SAMN04487991_0313 [Celeribacter neptunius]
MNIQMIETVIFQLAEGATETDLAARAQDLEAYFLTFPGYLGRALYKREDGNWVDQISWADQATMEACDAGFRDHPAAAPYMALVKPESVIMHRTPPIFAKAADLEAA